MPDAADAPAPPDAPPPATPMTPRPVLFRVLLAAFALWAAFLLWLNVYGSG